MSIRLFLIYKKYLPPSRKNLQNLRKIHQPLTKSSRVAPHRSITANSTVKHLSLCKVGKILGSTEIFTGIYSYDPAPEPGRFCPPPPPGGVPSHFEFWRSHCNEKLLKKCNAFFDIEMTLSVVLARIFLSVLRLFFRHHSVCFSVVFLSVCRRFPSLFPTIIC